MPSPSVPSGAVASIVALICLVISPRVGLGATSESPLNSNYVCDPLAKSFRRSGIGGAEPWPVCAPQFLIAGIEKSGTTSLFEYLKAHPDFLPVEGRYLLPNVVRARVIKTLMARAKAEEKKSGRSLKDDNRFDLNRWLRLANLTKAETDAAKAVRTEKMMKTIRLPELESHVIPIRLGKEVRFWTRSMGAIFDELGLDPMDGYEFYTELFAPIPAPVKPAEGVGSLSDSPLGHTWARTQAALKEFGLPSMATPPQYLSENLYKVSGEASPQYVDSGMYAPGQILANQPNTKLVFLVREPVRRYWSQAHMVDNMKGRDFDPVLEDFQKNVKRCLGSSEHTGEKHKTVREATVPGGGGVARAIAIDWSDPKVYDSSAFADLKQDLNACFSHGLSQFLLKGLYSRQFQQWLDAQYPREQMLIISSEEFFSQPSKVLQRVTHFVGLKPMRGRVWKNASKLRHSPHFDVKNLEFSLQVDHAPPAMANDEPRGLTGLDDETRELLEAFYAAPNCALRSILNEDWSDWGWKYCKTPTARRAEL